MKKILLIEDNLEVVEMIKDNFGHFFDFYSFSNYSEVSIDLASIDLILLDINLKNNENGLVFAEQLKNSQIKHIPIITISSNNDNKDIIQALKIGVNDYICKPLDMNLLFYKINNFLALIEPKKVFETVTKVADFNLIEEENVIKYKDVPLDLTKKEFSILSLLLKNYNKPVTRDKILEKINKGTITTPRVVDTHILNIRKKLPEGYEIIFSNRIGYCIKKNAV